MVPFSEGFNRVFPMEKLSSFSHKEVQMILCGNQSPSWTSEDVMNYTEPKLGYTRDRYDDPSSTAACRIELPLANLEIISLLLDLLVLTVSHALKGAQMARSHEACTKVPVHQLALSNSWLFSYLAGESF